MTMLSYRIKKAITGVPPYPCLLLLHGYGSNADDLFSFVDYFAEKLTVKSKINKTYAGYTSNLKKRIFLHNNSKGAKATKGHKWKLIFKKRFYSKKKAMSYEFKLKNDRVLRKKIINFSKTN